MKATHLVSLSPLSDWLISTFDWHHIPHSLPLSVTGVHGFWYLSPEQHLLEFFLLNFVVIYLIRRTYRNWKLQLLDDKRAPGFTPLDTPKLPLYLSIPLLISLSAAYLITLHQKVTHGTEWFLLQPCHMSVKIWIAVTLCLTISNSKTTRTIAGLVGAGVGGCISWGALLALATPDFRGYDSSIQIANFYIEHYLIILVPLFLTYCGYIPLSPPSRHFTFLVFLAKCLYHSVFLEIASLYSGKNLNYVMVPPPGPLLHFDHIYRPPMYMFCLALTFFTRYVFYRYSLKLISLAHNSLTSVYRLMVPSHHVKLEHELVDSTQDVYKSVKVASEKEEVAANLDQDHGARKRQVRAGR